MEKEYNKAKDYLISKAKSNEEENMTVTNQQAETETPEEEERLQSQDYKKGQLGTMLDENNRKLQIQEPRTKILAEKNNNTLCEIA